LHPYPKELAARLQNWFNSNIWDTSRSSTGPTYDLKGTDARMNAFGYYDNFSDEAVTERRVWGLATAWSCMNVRSRTIASLPIGVMQEDGKKQKIFLEDHPVYYPLAHQPNNYMSSANMFLTSMIHSDSSGNSIIGINRDGNMRPRSFELICRDDWDVQKVDGDAWYRINGEIYPSRDVLHFRWFSDDGLIGISPIKQNQITFGAAFKQDRYSGMAMGERPPGFLTYEGNLDPAQRAQNQKSWSEDRVNGKVPILSGRWDYKNNLIPPGDAEYLGSAGMTEQRICAIWQMPPVFLQNYQRATWSNAENADLVYAKHTITPIIRVIEQECNMKLFTEREKRNTFVKFNMNGLLRGDIQARAAFYTAMRNVGGMDGNEIRDREDMNAYEGGDIKTVQSANIPVDQLRDFYSKLSESTPPPDNKKNGHKVNGFSHEFN
jgi:HK97 family phage portal protein